MTNDYIQMQCRKAVAEGIVLLEHDGMLPLKQNDKVAIFGRAQFEYIKSGSGSGGEVQCPYITNIGDELKKRVNIDVRAEEYYKKYISEHPYDNGNGWAFPQSQTDALLDEAFACSLAKDNDKAIFVLSRLCGESCDFKAEKGGYYLTDIEEQMLAIITRYFKHVCVLLNVGNIIDMSWVKKYNVGTIAYVWQGGQEGGAGVAQALVGDFYPSGRLADTIAKDLSDYPAADNFGNSDKNIHTEDIFVGYRYFETFARDRVLYPFGYGLSYTKFSYCAPKISKNENKIEISITVKNTGRNYGKEVVQCYVKKPQGELCKPARELVAFHKTKLLKPDECEIVKFNIDLNSFASYNDNTVGEFANSYVLEYGKYEMFVGSNVRDAECIFNFTLDKTLCVKKCRQAVSPTEGFKRIITKDGETLQYENVPLRRYDINERICGELPEQVPITGDRGIDLQSVADGKHTMDEFIAQFNLLELCAFVRGEGMSSAKANISGTAASFGGVTPSWLKHGVPVVSAVDGPCGVRLVKKDGFATCIPSGTLIACMWAPELAKGIFDIFAHEMREYKLDIALGPGMNIHRHPLGGRNFEYFSEDPLLTGENAAAIVKYFDESGISCTLKHFAVNSQENNRISENEIVSERALREIYLKGFEIAVATGKVQYIMSSYNRINGISAASNYDLMTTVLRNEWGYKGMVMTDWWSQIDDTFNGTYSKLNLAAMIRARNDIYMVTSDADHYADDLLDSIDNGTLTIAQLQTCAKSILNVIMNTLSFKQFDKTRAIPIIPCDIPIKKYENVNSFKFDINEEGKFIVKIVYSCEGDSLVQNEERVIVDSKFQLQKLLLKGTDSELETQSVLLNLYYGALVEFSGNAKISSIEIYKLKS